MICRNEKVLSDRTADLCSVIRSYRNLIHPGRMVRLGEQAPDQGSSTIALAVTNMIMEELANILRTTVGLTGEQILSKIQRDANCLVILKHLLAEVSERQRERLLLELIPSAHLTISQSDDPFDSLKDRLEAAYRIILDTVPDNVHTRVASEFVRVLREEDGERVLSYGAAFFMPSDMQFVSKQDHAMVREHLLGIVSNAHTPRTLARIDGLAKYLEPNVVGKWLDPFIRTLVSHLLKANVKEKAREHLLRATLITPSKVNAAIEKRLDSWISHFEEKNAKDNAEMLRQLKKDIAALEIPF